MMADKGSASTTSVGGRSTGIALVPAGDIALSYGCFYSASAFAWGWPSPGRPLLGIAVGGALAWVGTGMLGMDAASERQIPQHGVAVAGVLLLLALAVRLAYRHPVTVQPREGYLAVSAAVLLALWHRGVRARRYHRVAGGPRSHADALPHNTPRVLLSGDAAEYGITRGDLRRVSAWGAALGGSAFVRFLIVGLTQGSLHAHWGLVLGMPAVIGGALPAVVFTTSSVTIRVGDGVIQEVLLGRTVLQQQPISEVVGWTSAGATAGFGIVFRDGSRVRLHGASRRERRRLIGDLRAMRSQASHDCTREGP